MSVENLEEKLFARFALDEFNDYAIYKELSKIEKKEEHRLALERLSEMEYEHYKFWISLIPGKKIQGIGPFKIFLTKILRIVFGLTFTLKLLERHEKETIKKYENVIERLQEDKKRNLIQILKEEKEHESYLISQINEAIVKYMSFVMLGLADAIIEINGVHAGFLGVTSSTLIAGIAGLVVGFAAAISMASAAYLQAKQGFSGNPASSAIITGMSYIGAVSFLALPYFLIPNMLTAFCISLSLAILLIGVFTSYGAVLREASTSREFITGLSLTIGTAFAAFLFGEALGRLFGVHPYMT